VSAFKRQQRFRAGDEWLVKVISLQPPGADVPSQFYQVLRSGYLVTETRDPWRVRRVMGDSAYAELTEVDL
jgi:hypothetical protein